MKRKQLVDHNTAKGMTGFRLRDVFGMWLDDEKLKVAAGHKRKSSLRTDLNGLTHIMNEMGEVDIGIIDENHVMEYQAARRKDQVKPVTINTETRKLKALMNWCFDKRLIDRPLKFRSLREFKVQTEVPTLEEMVKILDELPFKIRVLMRLMIETGLRKSEAYGLRWEQVDFSNNRIRICETETFDPKGETSVRDLIMGEGLKQDLIKLRTELEESDWVFPSDKNPCKHIDNCRKSLQSAIVRSGVERFGKPMKFTPKYGRKAFSSYQWINGTPLELIKKMMGHSPSSRVTLDHYIHMPDEAMKDRVIEMPL
ncbi:MAG: tyrosine-type recombinase/integrase [Lentilitoribacter sp.]